MSSFTLTGFFALAGGKRVVSTRSTKVYYCFYMTTIQCSASVDIPADIHIYSPYCQTVNLSNQTLVVSDVSRVRENLFRSSRSPGFPVPNSEPHGTTWNRSEATSPKVIPACVRLLHTTPFSHTFYLTTCQT